MLHDHVDVIGGDAILSLSSFVGGGGGLLGSSSASGDLGGSVLSVRVGVALGMAMCKLLGLGLGHALVGVVILELAEADKLVAVVARDQHLRVVDHEDEAIALLDGNAGDARELLHAELGKGLAALLLASVKLGAV